MQRYCLGFAFDSASNAVLIRKNRPDWMRGMFNGIGGKVNDNETYVEGMVREFQEETSVQTNSFLWNRFATLTDNIKYEIGVFHSLLSQETISKCKTMTDEEIFIIPNGKLYEYYVDAETPWLIALAIRNIFSTSEYDAKILCTMQTKFS